MSNIKIINGKIVMTGEDNTSSPEVVNGVSYDNYLDEDRIRQLNAFNNPETEKYKNEIITRDVPRDEVLDAQDDERAVERRAAKEQPWYEQISRMAKQIVVNEALLGSLQGFADLYDFAANLWKETGQDDYTNPLTEWVEGAQEKLRERWAIYRENPDQTFDWDDFGWWTNGMVSVGSTVGLLIPGQAIGTGAKLGVKGLSAAAKASRINRGLHSVAEGRKLVKAKRIGQAAAEIGADIGYATMSRIGENQIEAREVYKDVYQQELDRLKNMSDDDYIKFIDDNPTFKGKSKEEVASYIADESATKTFKEDMGLLLLDFVQFQGIRKLSRAPILQRGAATTSQRAAVESTLRRMAGSRSSNVVSDAGIWWKLGDKIKHPFQLTMVEQLSEGFEEGFQGIATEHGKDVMRKYDDATFIPRSISDYLFDPTIHEQAFWGWVGGMAFTHLAKGAYKLRDKAVAKFDKSKSDNTENKLRTLDDIRNSEIRGWSDNLNNFLNDYKLIQEGYDVFRQKKDEKGNPLKDAKGNPIYEEIENEASKEFLSEKLVTDYVTNLMIRATRVGNEEALLTFLKDPRMQKFLQDSGFDTKEDDFSRRVMDIADEAADVHRQELYKAYWNTEGDDEAEIAYIAAMNTRERMRRRAYDRQIQEIDSTIAKLDYEGRYGQDYTRVKYIRYREILEKLRIEKEKLTRAIEDNKVGSGSVELNIRHRLKDLDKQISTIYTELGALVEYDAEGNALTIEDIVDRIESSKALYQHFDKKAQYELFNDLSKSMELKTETDYTDAYNYYSVTHEDAAQAFAENQFNIITNWLYETFKDDNPDVSLNNRLKAIHDMRYDIWRDNPNVSKEVIDAFDYLHGDVFKVWYEYLEPILRNLIQNQYKQDTSDAVIRIDGEEVEAPASPSTGESRRPIRPTPPSVTPTPTPEPVTSTDEEIKSDDEVEIIDDGALEDERVEIESILDGYDRRVAAAEDIDSTISDHGEHIVREGYNAGKKGDALRRYVKEELSQYVPESEITDKRLDNVINIGTRRYNKLRERLNLPKLSTINPEYGQANIQLIEGLINDYIKKHGLIEGQTTTTIDFESFIKDLINDPDVSREDLVNLYLNLSNYIRTAKNSKFRFTNINNIYKQAFTHKAISENLSKLYAMLDMLNKAKTEETNIASAIHTQRSNDAIKDSKTIKEFIRLKGGDELTFDTLFKAHDGEIIDGEIIRFSRNGKVVAIVSKPHPIKAGNGFAITHNKSGFKYAVQLNNGVVSANTDALIEALLTGKLNVDEIFIYDDSDKSNAKFNRIKIQANDAAATELKNLFAQIQNIHANKEYNKRAEAEGGELIAVDEDEVNRIVNKFIENPIMQAYIKSKIFDVVSNKKSLFHEDNGKMILNTGNYVVNDFIDTIISNIAPIISLHEQGKSYDNWKQSVYNNYESLHKMMYEKPFGNLRVTVAESPVGTELNRTDGQQYSLQDAGLNAKENKIFVKTDEAGSGLSIDGTNTTIASGLPVGSMGYVIGDLNGKYAYVPFDSATNVSGVLKTALVKHLNNIMTKYVNKEISQDAFTKEIIKLFGQPRNVQAKHNNFFAGYRVVSNGNFVAIIPLDSKDNTFTFKASDGKITITGEKNKKIANTGAAGISEISKLVDSIVGNLKHNRTFFAFTPEYKTSERYDPEDSIASKENGKFVIKIGDETFTYDSYTDYVIKNNAFTTTFYRDLDSQSFFKDSGDLYINIDTVSTPTTPEHITEKDIFPDEKARADKRKVKGKELFQKMKIDTDIIHNLDELGLIPDEVKYDKRLSANAAFNIKDKTIKIGPRFFEQIAAVASTGRNGNRRGMYILIHEQLHKIFSEADEAKRKSIVKDLLATKDALEKALKDGTVEIDAVTKQQILNVINQLRPEVYQTLKGVDKNWKNLSQEEKEARMAEEWLMESLTSPGITQLLNKVKWTEEGSATIDTTQEKTLWQKIIDALLNILGLNIQDETILARQYNILRNLNNFGEPVSPSRESERVMPDKSEVKVEDEERATPVEKDTDASSEELAKSKSVPAGALEDYTDGRLIDDVEENANDYNDDEFDDFGDEDYSVIDYIPEQTIRNPDSFATGFSGQDSRMVGDLLRNGFIEIKC